MRRTFLIALLIGGLSHTALAQNQADNPEVNFEGAATDLPIRFENLTLEDGLSQSTVYSIAQDSKGFMWFGTEIGLNRYDNSSF